MRLKNLINKVSLFPTEENMHQLISFFEKKKINIEEIAFLAETLSKSGQMLKINKKFLTADIASTGGPSSLTTVLCPLFLIQYGFSVPKLGVPGRPAGGIDILSQIPGYKIHFNREEFRSLIEKYNYIHALADNTFCPLDISLFNFRKKINKLKITSLVVASILSKKIALGVQNVGLDIRVSPNGNFGEDFCRARDNAQIFMETAKLLNISAKCFITDIRFPLQPYIGRGEGLIALHNIIENKSIEDIIDHINTCRSMAASLGYKPRNKSLKKRGLKSILIDNLEAQGSSYENFVNIIDLLNRQKRISIKSDTEGFLNINLQRLKEAIVKAQITSKKQKREFPDPVGCILKKKHGDFVKKGEIVAYLRINQESNRKFIPLIQNSFSTHKAIIQTSSYEEVL